MKRCAILCAAALSVAISWAGPGDEGAHRGFAILSRSALLDKIRGGWAGKVIGCTLGGPTEFVFKSAFIPLEQPLAWSRDAVKASFDRQPGLYDDVYVNLTFVQVFEDVGLDAPSSAFAERFARAPFPLWHANQMARYNILNDIEPPQSGAWLNNPHADDIDFQIEADFAGLMCPGMVNAAAEICARVGHIMNFGDGYYGGLFVAAMEALAFVESDVHHVVEKALAVIPPQAAFARTIRAVIEGHRRNPSDWRKTWFEVEKEWGRHAGCPEGVFRPFDIDAKINAAWVVLGLLYGDGDFGKTITISCRGGDDSDCNPATAGGVLGVMLGLSKIPAAWKAGLEAIDSRDFPYTSMTLPQASDLTLGHALEMIKRNGGQVRGEMIRIMVDEPAKAPFEAGFIGHYPRERRQLGVVLTKDNPEAAFEFDGIGLAVNGGAAVVNGVAAGGGSRGANSAEGVLILEAQIDGASEALINLPLDERVRKPTVFWKYQMKRKKHTVRFQLVTPPADTGVRLDDVVIYGDKPAAPPY